MISTSTFNEEPRRKRTGYQDVFYSDTPQAAGNSPLTTIKTLKSGEHDFY